MRLEISRNPVWRYGKIHWIPSNYSAEAHHQIRWLCWIITLWKKGYEGYN